jgi:predicted permease
MPPIEARRQALRDLGGLDQTKERYRDRGTLPFVEHIVVDLRLAARTLAKRPLLVASAVLSIGIGVGLNVSLYAVVRRALFDSFITTPTPDRLAWVSEGVSFPDYEDIRQRLNGIDLAAMQMTGLTWNNAGETISASTHVVSRNFFDTLGVPAFAGRTFNATDGDAAHDPYEVVLSYGFWQRRVGGDSSAIGRTLLLNDRPYAILGIMPRGFSSMFVMTPDLYVPIDEHVTTALFDRNPAQFDLLARVPAGASREQSTAAVRAAAEEVEVSVPRTHTGWARAIVLRPTSMVGSLGSRPAIVGVTVFAFLLTGLVLLVACANVAGLLLARVDARRHEVAVRIALGATRARIMQQFLAESFLIGMAGCAVGAAAWTLSAALAPQAATFLNVRAQITVLSGPTPFIFCAALAVGVTLACGILPAVGASHAAPVGALRREAAIPNVRPLVLQRALIATEVAVSVVLLTAAATLLQTFIHVQTSDPGFDAVHTVHIDTSGSSSTRIPTFFELKNAVVGLPGVLAVSGARLPLAFVPLRQQLRRVGGTDERSVSADVEPVKSRYFETMRIPLERGRDLQDDDLRSPPGIDVAAVANDTFARQYLAAGIDVARFVVPADTENGIPERTLRIVGIARDSLGKADVATLYMADARPLHLIVRVAGPAEGAVSMLRSAVAKRELGATVTAAPMSDQIAFALLPSRIGMWVLCAMGGVALLLAMVGLHGAVSYATSRRTFEIGVRTALGASRGSIVRMVLKDGATAVGAGCAIGAIVAIPILYALRPILAARQNPFDPLTLVAVFAILLVVGVMATLKPARRATRVDPLMALRSE